MKKLFLRRAKQTGVGILSAIFILSAPMAVLADEVDFSESIVIEQERSEDFTEEVKLYLEENSEESSAVMELDLSDKVFSMGSLTGEEEISLDEGILSEVGEKLDNAVDNLDFCVDVSEYEIKLDEADDITADFLNDNPQYFYVDSAAVSFDEQTEIVEEIYFYYLADSATERAQYEQAVSGILAGINDSWSEIEVLFYLHDYIVTHCQYDLTYSKYYAYDALVDGSAVCNGYALAFQDLANRAGIETEFVSSSQKNHAWNLVTLNEKKYYVDCTWDDPTASYTDASGMVVGCHQFENYCGHNYFLKSQDFFDSNHACTDLITSKSVNVIGLYNNKEFDEAEWTSSNSPVVCMDNEIVYLKCNGDICKAASGAVSGTKLASVMGSGDRYYVSGGTSGSYYTTTYGTILMIGNTVFVNGSKNVKKLDLNTGSLTNVYSLPDSEKQTLSIYGMRADKSSLMVYKATGYKDVNLSQTTTIDVSEYLGGAVVGIDLNKNFIVFESAGETETITASVLPAGTPIDSWTSSNPGVATVSSNGLVTAVSPGVTTITVRAGGKSARCTVSFNTVWQKDYTYVLTTSNPSYIELDLYNGTEKNLLVPAYAIVDGNRYVTRIRGRKYISSTSYSYQGVFADNTNLETVTIEEGVVFPEVMYNTFMNCSNLKEVSFAGTDTSAVIKWVQAFWRCSKLTKIDFVRCDLSKLTTATNLLYLCNKLEEIKAPASLNTSVSIPVSMREVTLTGLGTENITDLKNASSNATLLIPSKYVITGIALNSNSVSGYKGESVTLEATFTPVNPSDIGSVIWRSSDSTVATVAGGVVTFVGNGDAIITILNANGTVSASCNVSVRSRIESPAPLLKKGTNGIDISWDAQDGVTKYRIFKKSASSEWNALADVTGYSFTDTDCVSGNEYSYLVRCLSEDGRNIITAYDSTKIRKIKYINAVSPIPDLSLTANGVKIAWGYQAGVSKYRIYKKEAAGAWVALADVTGNAYTDTNCTQGVDYSYLVRCLSEDGKSIISVYDSTTIRKIKYVTIVSPKPTLAKAADGISVSWSGQPGVTKYRIYKKGPSGGWVALADISGTSYRDTECENGAEYCYLVRCLSADGKTLITAYDSTKISKIIYVNAVSPALDLTKVADGIQVSWDSQLGVSKYRIYKKGTTTGWVALSDVTGTTYTDTDCASGMEYSYLVRCLSSDGKSLISSYDSSKIRKIKY